MLRLPLVVVLFWSEKFTPCEGSEVDTSLVTLQGSSCCLTCCWCVAQDTTVILRATWMLGYASRHETVILRAVWSTRGTVSSSTKCAEHRLTFVVVPSRMYHMIFIPLFNCLDTYTRTVTRWNVRTLYKPYQNRWLIIARAHHSDMTRGSRFTEKCSTWLSSSQKVKLLKCCRALYMLWCVCGCVWCVCVWCVCGVCGECASPLGSRTWTALSGIANDW